MFYSFKNCKVSLNGQDILANSASISESSSNEAIYDVEHRHGQGYSATWGIGGNFRVSYYLTGIDFVTGFITGDNSLVSGNFGGIHFKSGYLSSYSLEAQPNRPPTVTAEFQFFDDLKDTFAPTYEGVPSGDFMSFSDATFTNHGGQVIFSTDNISDLEYSYGAEIVPVYLLGELKPSRIHIGRKEIRTRLRTDVLSGNLNISGEPVQINFNFRQPVRNYTATYKATGILHGRELSADVGRMILSTLSIRQDSVGDPPTVDSISVSNGSPGTTVTINGTNLLYPEAVYFGDTKANFTSSSSTQISATIPEGGITGPISVIVRKSTARQAGNFTVNQPAVNISGISPHTGAIGDTIRISGTSFLRTDAVTFTDDQSGVFQLIDANTIEVQVPEFTAWGAIKVKSADKGTTATSTALFVPISRIDSFSPVSGLSGQVVIISGRGFSGASGVAFNNLTGSFTILGNTGISVTVPSGNTKGKIRVSGQSGVLGFSTIDFLPIARLTGISPSSGKTGASISFLGENLIPELLLQVGSSFMVGFQNDSGAFTRINTTRLDGTIPSGTKSGLVFVYAQDYSSHPSTILFDLIREKPTVSGVIPFSGKKLDYVSVLGTNFVNVNDVTLTGSNTGTIISASSLTVSSLETSLSFQIPSTITGGLYDVRVNARDGAGTGTSAIRVLDKPHISGFIPTSGAIGQRILLSGLRLYPDTVVYHNFTGVKCAIVSGTLGASFDTLQFEVPPGASGTGFIITDNGVAVITGSTFTTLYRPEFSGFNPVSGQYHQTVLVSGRNIDNVSFVYIGTTQVTGVTVTATTGVRFFIPENAETDLIRVSGSGGFADSELRLSVITPPITVSGFIPTSTRPLRDILISGHRMNTAREVWFSGSLGGIAVTGFTGIAATGIRVTVPALAADGTIRIVNDWYESASSDTLDILPVPRITSFGMASGISGNTVAVTGTDFTIGGTQFYFQGVTGQPVLADSVSVASTTTASFTVPREVIMGVLMASGNDEISTSSGIFTPLPQISGIGIRTFGQGDYVLISGLNAFDTYRIGITGEGTWASLITGTIFKDIRNINGAGITNPNTGVILLSGAVHTSFFGSGRVFLATSGDAGLDDTLTNFTKSETYRRLSTLITSFSIEVTGLPFISGFNPISGSSKTAIKITGENLAPITSGILFTNGLSDGYGSFITSGRSEILMYPPSSPGNGSGQVTVRGRYGNHTSTQYWRWIPDPVISGFTPATGITGSYFTITGTLSGVTGFYFGTNLVNYINWNNNARTDATLQVPPVEETIPRNFLIIAASNAGTYTGSSFYISPGPTTFYGTINISGDIITTGIVAATGFRIEGTGNITGDSFSFLRETGNYLELVHRVATLDWRGFSHKLT